jgi:hypothetical protein
MSLRAERLCLLPCPASGRKADMMLAATPHYSNVSLDACVLFNMCIIGLPVFRLTPVVRPLTRSHVLYPPRHTSNLFLRPRPPLNVNTHANENAPLLFLCS